MPRSYLNTILIIAFLSSSLGPVPNVHAKELLGLPVPGSMIGVTTSYVPAMIKGLTVHQDNPFLFDFIVDVGQDKMEGKDLENEGQRLIKYFMAGLAIPEKDLWVNLSPYEKDRTIPEALSQTDMGRDLLAQDYILKQLTASLIYPEKELGKKFWDKVYAEAQRKFGTTEIPVNTFNKVWIMADRAEVFERNQTVFVTDSHLKVMLEEDYLALEKNKSKAGGPEAEPLFARSASEDGRGAAGTGPASLASQIVREIIIPELEKEVNEGRHFANLRQIFNSLILAGWYKNNLKEALLNQAYSDHSKVKGIDNDDKTIKEQIYQRYLQAYKKGVFNYIKEDSTNTPRKYFSGGMTQLLRNPKKTDNPSRVAGALPHDRSMVTMNTRLTLDMPIEGSMADQSRGAIADLVGARQGDVDPTKDDRLKEIFHAYHLLNDRETEHFNASFKWEEHRQDTLPAAEARSRLYARYGAISSPVLISSGGFEVPLRLPVPSYIAFHLFVFKDGSSLLYCVDKAMTSVASDYRDKIREHMNLISRSRRQELLDDTVARYFRELGLITERWVQEIKGKGLLSVKAREIVGKELMNALEVIGKKVDTDYLDKFRLGIEYAVQKVYDEDAAMITQGMIRVSGAEISSTELLAVINTPLKDKGATHPSSVNFKLVLSVSNKGEERERVIDVIKRYVQGVIQSPQGVFIDDIEKGQRRLYVIAQHERLFFNSLGELKGMAEKILQEQDVAMVVEDMLRGYEERVAREEQLSRDEKKALVVEQVRLARQLADIHRKGDVYYADEGSRDRGLEPLIGKEQSARIERLEHLIGRMEELTGYWASKAEFKKAVKSIVNGGYLPVFAKSPRVFVSYFRHQFLDIGVAFAIQGRKVIAEDSLDPFGSYVLTLGRDAIVIKRADAAILAYQERIIFAGDSYRKALKDHIGKNDLATQRSLKNARRTFVRLLFYYLRYYQNSRSYFIAVLARALLEGGVNGIRQEEVDHFMWEWKRIQRDEIEALIEKKEDREIGVPTGSQAWEEQELMKDVILGQEEAEKGALYEAERRYPLPRKYVKPEDREGGINLDTSKMNMNIRKDGNGVEMIVDPAMIERVKREGIESLTPVILKISPMLSIWPLFGLKAPETSLPTV